MMPFALNTTYRMNGFTSGVGTPQTHSAGSVNTNRTILGLERWRLLIVNGDFNRCDFKPLRAECAHRGGSREIRIRCAPGTEITISCSKLSRNSPKNPSTSPRTNRGWPHFERVFGCGRWAGVVVVTSA
jgi:hypothetical protein